MFEGKFYGNSTNRFETYFGQIKPMHAVNNGPVKGPRMFPLSGNFDAFREAGIPYVRNHDASFCASYGGKWLRVKNLV